MGNLSELGGMQMCEYNELLRRAGETSFVIQFSGGGKTGIQGSDELINMFLCRIKH